MTPDEIRSLEAGPVADMAFAEAVGLPVWDGEGSIPNVAFIGNEKLWEPTGNCERWHPSTDTGQAMDYAAKWLEAKGVGFGLVKYEHASDYWLWDFSCGRVSSYGKTVALAVVRGILLVALAVKK